MGIRILVMGLPGSGKTSFCKLLHKMLEYHFPDVGYYNANKVRDVFNDWDFSELGRVRQSNRMQHLVDHHEIGIADFVCPTNVTRKKFKADFIVWLNTIETSKYKDTNRIFEKPKNVNYEITNWNNHTTVLLSIIEELNYILDGESVQ